MKKILVKFSDERNKKYSIRTVIAQDEKTGRKFVVKENIYPEGKAHLKNIVHYSDVLKKAYPEVKICPVEMLDENSISFDFIEGVSLEEYYRQCLLKNSKEGIEKLLAAHKGLILGAKENTCKFTITDDFSKVFGMDTWKGDQNALKTSNFDVIASNVIYQGKTPVFIDYEWVYEFPIPVDLVIFHCVRDAYYHIKGLDAFYPLKDAMAFLGVQTDLELLEEAYSNFYSYVIKEEDGSSYANCKKVTLKGRKQGDVDSREYIEKLEWDIMFFERNWKEACQAAAVVNQRIASLEKEEVHHKMHVQQLEEAVQEQARLAATYKTAYETVINSRTWRLASKFKRLLGRK